MKLIIDISEELYNGVTAGRVQNGSIASKTILNAVKAGKPYVAPVNPLDKKDSHYDYWHNFGSISEVQDETDN